MSDVLAAVNRWADGPGALGELVYGVNDCCQFVGTVLRDLTARDFLSAFSYADQQEAEQILHGDLVGVVSAALGSDPLPVQDLAPGSPVCFGDALGILLDAEHVAGLSPRGRLFRLPSSLALFGWPWHQLRA